MWQWYIPLGQNELKTLWSQKESLCAFVRILQIPFGTLKGKEVKIWWIAQ